LLPLLREEAGKKLHDLVEEMTRATLKGLGGHVPSKETLRNVFTAVFRMLGGKILKDKGVHGFRGLRLDDPSQVLQAVARHYDRGSTLAPMTAAWNRSLIPAANMLNAAGSFSVVSPETLAYVYEHTLVTKALRKKLGVHATPPWLVDYMVWQLYDWIREIPINDRHVFEPACGHAPFLLSAMRLLRLEMQDEDDQAVHDYLKCHIHGVEIDDFAREIARLSLTLADIPNPNGWDLRSGDMYASNVLTEDAARCRIFLSNPPYEKFSDSEKRAYEIAGYPVANKKAVELLCRTLDQLPKGAVFAVVVPQTIVTGPEAKNLRKMLLKDFHIGEVCLFPGKVFEFAEIETAIILGCRRPLIGPEVTTRIRTIGEHGIDAFRCNYESNNDIVAAQSRLRENPESELKVAALDDLWQYLRRNSRVRDVALVGRGIEYKGKTERNDISVVVQKPRQGYPAGYAGVSRDQTIFTTPPERGLAMHPELIGNPRQGEAAGIPQVLINMGRTARSPWRIKATLDEAGRPFKNNFAVIRPAKNASALYLWAVLNSPIASAFVASRTMRKHNYEGLLGDIPLPRVSDEAVNSILVAAKHYRQIALTRAQFAQQVSEADLFKPSAKSSQAPTEEDVREALLLLDSVVLRAYALPVRLERQLLEYFRGYSRRGVGCTFGDYYPAGFKSLIPLHKYISTSYRGSTINAVAVRMKPGESAVVTAALRDAARAFGGDD
jgi:hypothetical protein